MFLRVLLSVLLILPSQYGHSNSLSQQSELDHQILVLGGYSVMYDWILDADDKLIDLTKLCLTKFAKNPSFIYSDNETVKIKWPYSFASGNFNGRFSCKKILQKHLPPNLKTSTARDRAQYPEEVVDFIQASNFELGTAQTRNLEQLYNAARVNLILSGPSSEPALLLQTIDPKSALEDFFNFTPSHSFYLTSNIVASMNSEENQLAAAAIEPPTRDEQIYLAKYRDGKVKQFCQEILKNLPKHTKKLKHQNFKYSKKQFEEFSRQSSEYCDLIIENRLLEARHQMSGESTDQQKLTLSKLNHFRNTIFVRLLQKKLRKMREEHLKTYRATIAYEPTLLLMTKARPEIEERIQILEKKAKIQREPLVAEQVREKIKLILERPNELNRINQEDKKELRDNLLSYVLVPFFSRENINSAVKFYVTQKFKNKINSQQFDQSLAAFIKRLSELKEEKMTAHSVGVAGSLLGIWGACKAIGFLSLVSLIPTPQTKLALLGKLALSYVVSEKACLLAVMVGFTGYALVGIQHDLDHSFKDFVRSEIQELRTSDYDSFFEARTEAMVTLAILAVFLPAGVRILK